ncbi:Hypothetical protein RAK1035_0615 [Roseovarius sp. AK1035]|nr:Hypothetical protein RAK1035_0615 [Roseovarius sp. AK1035]
MNACVRNALSLTADYVPLKPEVWRREMGQPIQDPIDQ